jgi:hypothetical protein
MHGQFISGLLEVGVAQVCMSMHTSVLKQVNKF